MGNWTDEELNQHTIDHAKYFTVVQVQRGGFVAGGSNYVRIQVDTLEAARAKAAEMYLQNKRGILIYAVADFAGANGFSRPVENYPPLTYKTKADKVRDEKIARQKAREAAREARLNLGAAKPKRAPKAPVEPARQDAAYDPDFMNAPEPMVMITLDD